jgi:hypothetical protein
MLLSSFMIFELYNSAPLPALAAATAKHGYDMLCLKLIHNNCATLCLCANKSSIASMNISNKPLVATIAALILAIGAAIGAKLWLAPNPEARVTASLNPACDLHAGPCASDIPGGGRIELSIEPRPIPLLRPLRLVVKAQGLDARQVEIDFTGVDMNMGYNRPQLKQEGEQFTGETVLPVCITGRMSWQAAVVVTTPKLKAVAPFQFTTSRN